MTDNHLDGKTHIEECVAKLKAKIPVFEHAALDSRVEALINDASADANDVVSILLQEFDPEPSGRN